MSLIYEFMFLLFSHLTVCLVFAGGDENKYHGECPASFNCGYLGNISFPFTTTQRQDCGLLPIHNCHDRRKHKLIQLQNKGKWFEVAVVNPLSSSSRSSTCSCLLRDTNLYKLLQNRSCEAFRYNYTLPPTFGFASFHIKTNATLFVCNRTLHVHPPTYVQNYTECPRYNIYYGPYINADKASESALTSCTNVHLPIKDITDGVDPFTFVTADFTTEVHITKECAYCHFNQKGQCQVDSKGRFYCANANGMTTWKHKHTLKHCTNITVVAFICFPDYKFLNVSI